MTEQLELFAEERRVLDWRYAVLVRAGFKRKNATLLAESGCDLHQALDMLADVQARGFDQKIIVEILT